MGSVYVKCEYEKQVCPIEHNKPCPHTYYSEYGQFTDALGCSLYTHDGSIGRGGSSVEAPCDRLTWQKKVIAKSVKRFSYEENGDYADIVIGNTKIDTFTDNVIYLAVDFGDGERIYIDEREDKEQ